MRLQSKAPFGLVSPESCGFLFDRHSRLSVVVAWLNKWSQICNGNLGSVLHIPAIKCSFLVPIYFSAGLVLCRCGGTNWKLFFSFIFNSFSTEGYSLSIN